MSWFFEVDPHTNEYVHQSDEAFALRCEARENAIYEAANRLGISRDTLEKDNYVGKSIERSLIWKV